MIQLITHTPNPEEVLINSFSKCYQKKANIQTVLRHLKHESVLEHVSYTFDIRCSRLTHLQFVRHRIASYTSQSHRYTKPIASELFEYIPEEVFRKGLIYQWINDMEKQFEVYEKWVKLGFKKEDARYHLPCSTMIDFRVTMNLRSIINFLKLRTAPNAQSEIKEVAENMMEQVLETIPNLASEIQEIIESSYSII